MELKVCSKCNGDPKPIGEFHTRPNGKPYSYCKACHRNYTHDHYERNKASYVAKAQRNNQRYVEKIQDWILDYFKTHHCIDCGEDDPLVLEFDHRDGESKDFEIGKVIHRGWKLTRIIEEVACTMCQLSQA